VANRDHRMPAEERKPPGVGKVVHRSRRLYVAESQLVDSDGKEVARGSGTFVPSDILLSPKIGYA